MYYYCVLCDCTIIHQLTDVVLRNFDVEVLCPKIVQRYWKHGREELRAYEYLTGHFFVYSESPIHQIEELLQTPGIERILGDPDKDFQLTGNDLAFAQMLFDMDGCIGILKTHLVGNRVTLKSSLYHGFKGEITRIEKRRGRAQLDYEFDGQMQQVWIGYELEK